ncbi:SCO family protein [Bacillus pacificus]
MKLDLETFQFTNQDGKPFGTKDLKGKVWVVILCSQTVKQFVRQWTANMAKLQKMAKEEKLDVQFVSFSVDPDLDKPENLKAFIQSLQKIQVTGTC